MKKIALVAIALLGLKTANAAQTLDFDQLRDACQNPAKYHSQVQPTGIKVDCSDRQLTWVQAGDDSMTLPALRVVGHAVSSDKYTVPVTKAQINLPAINASCPVFKQIEENIAISQTLTCEQLLAFKGGATDLCANMIDQARGDNPAAIIKKETGKEVHVCQTNQDRGQRGQRDDERGQR